ncbi:MAG: FAD:protein FMN transferase [Ignavibacteria bacterium]|nr:FAD:protein FMN transferase [Ignavibacteria bacterium]
MSAVYHSGFYAMGTRLNLLLPSIDEEVGERVVHSIRHEVQRIESLLSFFSRESEVSMVNRYAWREKYRISEELFTLLETCIEFGQLTCGAFDVTMRPLLDFWKGTDSHTVDEETVKRLREHLGYEKILLNKDDLSVKLENDVIRIDLGGIGKGYALEKVRLLLSDVGIRNAFVSFGESSVLTVGRHPNGDCWKVGLRDHRAPESSLQMFRMTDASLSTSSNVLVSENGDPKEHRHVIDPRTGFPILEPRMVGVVSDSPLQAEALSTAFMILNDSQIEGVKSVAPDIHVVKIEHFLESPVAHEL